MDDGWIDDGLMFELFAEHQTCDTSRLHSLLSQIHTDIDQGLRCRFSYVAPHMTRGRTANRTRARRCPRPRKTELGTGQSADGRDSTAGSGTRHHGRAQRHAGGAGRHGDGEGLGWARTQSIGRWRGRRDVRDPTSQPWRSSAASRGKHQGALLG
jgi:hypothetical protein